MTLARTPRSPSSPSADGLTLTGLLDVLERAEPLPLAGRRRPNRAAAYRSPGGRALRVLPPARPVPLPRSRPGTDSVAGAPGAAALARHPLPAGATMPGDLAVHPAGGAGIADAVAAPQHPRPTLRARLTALTRRLALWGAGPDGANLAWGAPRPIPARPAEKQPPAAPAVPAGNAPVVLTELPSTPTIPPAVSSPTAALLPALRPRAAGDRSVGAPGSGPGSARARADPPHARSRGSPPGTG